MTPLMRAEDEVPLHGPVPRVWGEDGDDKPQAGQPPLVTRCISEGDASAREARRVTMHKPVAQAGASRL